MDDIIKRGTAAEIALAYTTATDEIRQAFQLLKSAKARLLAVNGQHRDAVFDAQFRGSGFDFDRDADDAVKTVRRNTWRSILDGRGPIEYPDDLATKISGEIHARRWECESEYFRCRWYKAGTLHIEFRRLDLVAKLNAVAGGKTPKEDPAQKGDA